MAEEVPIMLAVEDEVKRNICSERYWFKPSAISGSEMFMAKKAPDTLTQRLPAFNNAAKGIGFLLLTDLDNAACVPELIQTWFGCGFRQNYPKRKQVNLVVPNCGARN